jgi:hypothetical protein
MAWRILKWVLTIGIVLALPVAAYAQTEATISGTVTDQTGGVLPGVTITATHVDTGNIFVAVTDERGAFRLPVRVGNFSLAIELAGFATLNRTIELLVGQNAVVSLQMVPSTVQESVTVTGEAPLIDTSSSSLGGNIDPRQMQELPVNGRNWVDLTMLAPDIYTTPWPEFNGSLTGTREERKGIARFDFQFSTRTRLSVRGTRYDNEIPYDPRYTGGSNRTMASAIGTNRRSEQILGTLTQVLGTRALNEIKVGHDDFHWNQYPHARNPNSLPGMIPGFGAPRIDLQGFTLGQNHAITPQNIGDDLYMLRDDFTTSFSRAGRHDLKVGGEYIYHFTFETVCNQCMGQLDLQGGPAPANLPALIPNVHDVSTWNLAPLSSIARFYQRAIGMDRSPYSRPPGNHGFTEYAPRHVYAAYIQDDWQVAPRLTLNLGLRYDLGIGAFVNWVAFPPFIKGDRPEDKNNFGPRLGFAYSVTDRTVIRGGYGRYYADVTGQPAVFTLRNVQQITPQILNDGRPDFASNPFNGPAPTYDQAAQLLCSVSRRPGCLLANVGNFVADDLVFPYSHQTSIGVQRQFGTNMAVEANWVYTGERGRLQGRNINIAFNPAAGANYRFVGAGTDVAKRVYPDWGNTQVNRPDGKSNYHALQAGFTKRMSNRWQASATYTLGAQWDFDSLPLNAGCKYPMTITGNEPARCDVPITLAADLTENDWYLAEGRTGNQRHRLTFNGIWQLPYDFQLSGLYLFGENGKDTPDAGVDIRGLGGNSGIGSGFTRLRSDGTLIRRNSLDRSSIHRVDLRIQRRFRFADRVGVDGIFEVYNLFDRANFNAWVLNERNARFAQPEQDTNLAYAPRMLQLGFRATF